MRKCVSCGIAPQAYLITNYELRITNYELEIWELCSWLHQERILNKLRRNTRI